MNSEQVLGDQVAAFRLLFHGKPVSEELAQRIASTLASRSSAKPTGPVDLYECQAARAQFVSHRLQQRLDAVKAAVETGHLPANMRQRATLELKMTAFLALQKKLRVTLESVSLGKGNLLRDVPIDVKRYSRLISAPDPFQALSDSLGRGLAKRARAVDARSEAVASVFQQIPGHFERFSAFHRSNRETAMRVAERCKQACAALEKKKVDYKERQERERMKLLKTNNYEEYVKMLKQTKNTRLNELIDQTDKFLQEIGIKVAVQKQETAAHSRHVTGGFDAIMATEDDVPNEGDVTGFMDYYSSVHQIKEEVKQPACLTGGTLMAYQIAGLQWLVSLYNNKLNGILADEMGLGKTVQTIALLAYLEEVKANPGPHLVIVPLSTLPNWQNEFERWLPGFKVLTFKGSKIERRQLIQELKQEDYNVCLTTYDFVLREKSQLSNRLWRHIIVDEGHRMKNAKGKLHAILNGFKCTNRLLLTGTPLQNNLTELWSLLNFLLPRIFSSADDFEQWFSEPFAKVQGESDAALSEEEQLLVIHRLHVVLRPFLLRRIKSEVLTDLPDKQEFVIRVELSEWQRLAYDKMTESALSVMSAEGKVTNKTMHNSLMQLRKIANHPFLFLDEYRLDEDLFRVSGKFEILDRMLPKLVSTGHKVLIFSQMTSLLDVLGDYLDWKGLGFFRLDGSTSLEERRERMHTFNGSDEVRIFMLSTRAGGLGVNLQTADTVIIFDSDFNPQMDLQAQDRAHRVGQKNQVKVFRLITLSPIEQLILDKANHKLDLDSKIIQAGMFNRNASDDDRRERLKSIFESGGTAATSVHPTTPEELNRALARSTEEFVAFQEADAEVFGVSPHDLPQPGSPKQRAPAASGSVTTQKLAVTSTESVLVDLGRLISIDEVPEWVRGPSRAEGDDDEQINELTREMRKSRLAGSNMGAIDRMSDRQWLKLVMQEEEQPVAKKTKPKPDVSVGVNDLEEGDRIRLSSHDSTGYIIAEVDVLSRREITLTFLDGCSDISLPGTNLTLSAAEFGNKYTWELAQ